MRRLALIALVGALVLAMMPAASARNDGPKHNRNDYWIDYGALPFEALPGAEAYWGEIAGAAYRIEMPANFNGNLVMWAHGYRGAAATGDTRLFVDNHPLRDFLIANGYAWAASSYAKNDYNIGQGVLDTHRLAKQFKSITGEKPDKTYITGASMGGHVTAVSIEQFPNAYVGAMPICGVLAGDELFDYFGDFSLVAQTLAGTSQTGFPVADFPAYAAVDKPLMKATFEAFPGTWPFALSPAGQQLKDVTEQRSGGDRPNFDEAFVFWNGLAGDFLMDLAADTRTVPVNGVGVGNVGTVYQFDNDPALTAAEQALNDTVIRQAKDPSATNYNGMSGLPVASGDIGVPVLTLHNLGDLFVPFHMETVYADRVAASGNADLLVQRAIRGVNHCGFTGIELATAFSDLVAWVELGIEPAGDDVSDPAAVAAPDFGCQFTDFSGALGSHLLATPCP